MFDTALGIYTYAEFFTTAGVFLPPMVVSSALHRGDPTQREPGRWMRRFGRTAASLSPVWRFSVEGKPPADIHTRGHVVVSNHESTADPFLLSHLPWDMRWVAKEELFRLPVLGLMMKCSGDIPLRRGSRESVVEMLNECERTLRAGQNVMIFPEGTRSRDGSLGSFKDGAFSLAIRTGAPILPLALAGTHACRPKGSIWFGRARAVVKVLAPISTEGMTEADLPRLREATRDAIASHVPALRARTGFETWEHRAFESASREALAT